MHHTGIEKVVYGVEDIKSAVKFWRDFGLESIEEDGSHAVFAAQNGATIEVFPCDDPDLPPPPSVDAQSTVREVTFGVRTSDDLASLKDKLSAADALTKEADGTLHASDPLGFGFAFRLAQCEPIKPDSIETNVPGNIKRLNQRGQKFDRATPLIMSHIVYVTDDLETHKNFYIDTLGFKLTDSYPGRGYFMRCADANNHHNLFLLDPGKGKRSFHHLAFELGSIHELFGGGNNMTRNGWETMIGPGRHPVSSCYFWYFKNPCGGAAEYDFDSDVVDDNWQPRQWESTPENFAEWCLGEGMGEALLHKQIQNG
ncbi:MAG: glyoxalase [Rhodospirillaceae bacterium]|nr:glyoxalase [Rhodospirillaceae bacterium]|tara:strand:+ start:24296 stop:25234 length:939 start_codon:yes stop_codon:yes gene_type:complete